MDKMAALAAVAADLESAGVTPLLRATATQLVPGDGNPDAELMLIGEAPGATEDRLGRPFVGAAGRFLDELLASINLDRRTIFITNILKYRPPGNRDPRPDEIAASLPYLQRQIEIIQPKLIAFLGRHAMNVFLPELTIGQAHGQVVWRGGQAYLPLYHPAAAIYNRSLRPILTDDFNRLRQILDDL